MAEIRVNSTGAVKLFDNDDSHFVGLQAGSISSDVTFTLPTADGSNGQVLTTNGSGALSFATASSANPTSADGDSLGTASLEWSDLFLADGGIIYFGNDQDVTLTHDPDDGLFLKSIATADNNPVLLTLQTGETDMAADDVIGKIAFQAPDEGTGTDAILVSAAIQAVAEGDHSSSSNATRIEFMVGASEAAAKKMQLTSAGKLEVDGGIDIEGGAVFNEDSADVDFRVESNGNANMLHVSGGNNLVGVGAEGDLGSGLHIKASDCGGGSVSANSDNLVIEENGNVGMTMLGATNGGSHIFFGHSGDEDEGALTYDNDNNRMTFRVNGTIGMRLLGTEVLCIGTLAASGSPATSCLELSGTEAPLSIINETATDSSDRTSIALRNSSGTLVGNVGVDNSNAMFNTSSDYRLKENEVAISDGITRIKQLKPYKFNFKIQADKTVDGFFAHEVSSIVPEAITGEKDATETLQKVVLDSSGNIVAFNVEQSKWTQGKTDGEYANDTTWEASKEIIKSQSIDQSKLVPLLTSALQEAITKIEALEARVTTLEG
jgi:hypothetical protein